MGDLATPIALELAKALKRKPREIAEQLAAGMQLPPLVGSVTVEGAGYLNFRFDRGAFTAEHFRNVMAASSFCGRASDRRAHEHQSEQGRAHRPSSQRRPRRHVRPLLEVARAIAWRRRTTSTTPACRWRTSWWRSSGWRRRRSRTSSSSSRRTSVSTTSAGMSIRRWPSTTPTIRKRWSGGARRCTPSSRQEGDTAELAAIIARAIVQSPSRDDAAPRHRVRPAAEGERHHSPALLGSRLRAAEGIGRGDLRDGRKEQRLLGHAARRVGAVRRHERARQDPRALQRHRHVRRQGHRVSALEAGAARSDVRLPQVHDLSLQPRAVGDVAWRRRRGRGAEVRRSVTRGQRDRLTAGVPAEGRERGRAAGGGPKAAEASIHFAYEMVALTPATAKALGMQLSEEDSTRPYVEMSGRKGFGVKADDMLDELEREGDGGGAEERR